MKMLFLLKHNMSPLDAHLFPYLFFCLVSFNPLSGKKQSGIITTNKVTSQHTSRALLFEFISSGALKHFNSTEIKRDCSLKSILSLRVYFLTLFSKQSLYIYINFLSSWHKHFRNVVFFYFKKLQKRVNMKDILI